jgi:putative (di)nucleoside polyphosphate hydrolase
MRMQQLAWGSPLDLIQSFYGNSQDHPKEENPNDKSQ